MRVTRNSWSVSERKRCQTSSGKSRFFERTDSFRSLHPLTWEGWFHSGDRPFFPFVTRGFFCKVFADLSSLTAFSSPLATNLREEQRLFPVHDSRERHAADCNHRHVEGSGTMAILVGPFNSMTRAAFTVVPSRLYSPSELPRPSLH